MAFSSQPIAVAPSKQSPDFGPAYSPANFFPGSPMSLRTGSFQNRFYPGGSPGQSLGPIAVPDFKRGLASSWENDAGAWIKAVKNGDSAVHEDELCRNYVCCGVALPDLHALVDHFESRHVEVLCSPYDDPAPYPDDESQAGGTPAFDADDMEISEPSPSPPATPSPIMQSSAFDPIRVSSASDGSRISAFFRAPHQYHSSYSSLAGANGHQNAPGPSAFNRYAGYSDYSSNLPGTDPSPTYVIDAQKDLPHHHPHHLHLHHHGGIMDAADAATVAANAAAAASAAAMTTGRCVPPALLFSSSASPSPLNTPTSSRTSSPSLSPAPVYGLHTPGSSGGTLSLHPSGSSSSATQQQQQHAHNQPSTFRNATGGGAMRQSSTSSLTALTKPFRCPKVGCNKSYKQQNGLKYHLSHGQCNFAPRDPEVEKLSEVERDKRLRPFVCKVGTECNRRYKNMNGLRYHYTHTGEHGAIGLEMLAQGRHPLPDIPSSSRASSTQPKTPSPAHPQRHGENGCGPCVSPSSSSSSSSSGLSISSLSSLPPSSSSVTPAGFSRAGYFPNQQQLAPPVVSVPNMASAGSSSSSTSTSGGSPALASNVSTMPVPAPVPIVLPLHHGSQPQQQQQQQQHCQMQSPAPSPMNPFPPHGNGWLLGSD